MRRLIIALLVLLALIYFAADMMAQQKFSLFDRAVAQGGSTVATNGSVLMVGASGAILGKVWTGGDVSKAVFTNASGLLVPNQKFAQDASRAHWDFQFSNSTGDGKALVSLKQVNVAAGYGFRNYLCIGDCASEIVQGPWSVGTASGMTNPSLYLHPYNITYPTAQPSVWAFAFTDDSTFIIEGSSSFASGTTGCAARGRGFCVEDIGSARKARYGIFQERIIMGGYMYRWPSAPPTAQGQYLGAPASGTCPSDGSDVCVLVWTTPTTGTATSVGLALPAAEWTITNSPVTTTGTLTGSWKVQNANKVFAGPTTGADATPGFRALVADDVPNHSGAKITSGTVAAAYLGTMTGDAGAGGASGAVPAPAAGDAAASKFLKASGAWATPSGSDPTSAKGDLFTNNGSGPVALAVGSNTYVLTANSAATNGIEWAASGSSTPAQTFWIMADPNFTTGTSYERPRESGGYHLVQLAPQRTWQTIADCKANVPGGWTWQNSARVSTCDANTTTSGGLHLVSDTTGTDWNVSTRTALALNKPTNIIATSGGSQNFVARLKIGNANAGQWIAMIFNRTDSYATTGRILVNNTSGSACQIYADGTGLSAVTATATTAECGQGIWFRLARHGRELWWYYNKVNQATAPRTWTWIGSQLTALSDGGNWIHVGFVLGGGANTKTGDVLYYDDAFNTDRASVGQDEGMVAWQATGFDNASPVLTPVAGFDLGGSGATVADADVQAALTEIANPRVQDSAAWTFSVTRGSSAPVACGSYAAAASVTVGGSGRYISVCAKASSNGVTPGSLDMSRFRIPFKM